MVITKELFVTYLSCQTKAYLKNSEILYQQSKFGMWQSVWGLTCDDKESTSFKNKRASR